MKRGAPKGLRSYSVILAAEIGEPAAQVFHRIWYFCTLTKSGRVIDGERWIRNSAQQWRENHFPHWGLSKVNRALDTLVREGLVFKANHNPVKWLTALWYRVNPAHDLVIKAGYADAVPIVQNEQMHLVKTNKPVCSKRINRFVQNEQMHLVKMNASNQRDSSERFNQSRPSSSLRGEDEALIEKQLSRERKQPRSKGDGCGNANGISADSGPEENVSPPETEEDVVIPPPDPSDEQLKKFYGTPPPAIDFLAADYRSVNLWPYLRGFQFLKDLPAFFSREEIWAMDTAGPPALEAKYTDFVRRMLGDHFTEEIKGGIRAMAIRAARAGFLNRCGFRDFCERGLPEGYAASRPYGEDPYEEVVWKEM